MATLLPARRVSIECDRSSLLATLTLYGQGASGAEAELMATDALELGPLPWLPRSILLALA